MEAEDGFSAEVPIPDESSGDSGSGNDSAIEPSSHSPSPQNTPGIEKLVLAKSGVTSHVSGGTTVVTAVGDDKSAVTLAKLASSEDPSVVPNILTYRGATHQYRTSIPGGAAACKYSIIYLYRTISQVSPGSITPCFLTFFQQMLICFTAQPSASLHPSKTPPQTLVNSVALSSPSV